MKALFLLDPTVTFLNHGSFGACPRPVFEVYQRWQRELEAQPVEFLGRRILGLLAESRAALGAYVHADPDHLAYVVNATAGVNVMARAVAATLRPGDEVVTTDQEYGACLMAWEWELQRVGARLVQTPIPLPLTTPEAMIDALWSAVTPRTRAVYISHITSATAITLPVAAIIARARREGLISLIDGAHVPGHIDLDLNALQPDFYTGNLHKWLCTPKGSAFVYVHPDWQERTAPVYVSWGGYPGKSASFAQRLGWQGTHDPAAALSVPAAIDFWRDPERQRARAVCHEYARRARAELAALYTLVPIVPDDPAWFGQMIAAPLPAGIDAPALKARLYDEYRIEIPYTVTTGGAFLRASFQIYNAEDDLMALIAALKGLMNHADG